MNIEKKIAKSDPILGKIIFEIPKPHIINTNDVFHDLMSCIIEQQIHYRSTKKIFQKMLDAANIEKLTPENFHQFEKEAFTPIKLAAGKYETIESVLDFWQKNKIEWDLLYDKNVILNLASIKGIGKWIIDMILLYTLARPNIFPYDDFHLKQIMVSLYGLNPNVKLKAQMIEISEKWENQKSLAVLYLLSWKQYNKSV